MPTVAERFDRAHQSLVLRWTDAKQRQPSSVRTRAVALQRHQDRGSTEARKDADSALRASAFNSAYVAMSSPPSTWMTLPLIQVRAGSLRATRVWATSSGVVMRPAG
jgi:hypothetical protein